MREMSPSVQPYYGVRIALGSMHGKERAIGRAFMRFLGAEVVPQPDLDTDAYGTFSGEIPRVGTKLETARAKARAAMYLSGSSFGLASEGSYGPHPYLPFLPGGTELLVFIDDTRKIEIVETLIAPRTNFSSHACAAEDDVRPVLERMGFPSHAVIVQPNVPEFRATVGARPLLFKGLSDADAVRKAIAACTAASKDAKALIVTDLRAHLNPTRMAVIRMGACRLARRMASSCPACGMPGFGIADVVRGLRCTDCGSPTRLPVATLFRCVACSHSKRGPLNRTPSGADPAQCDYCNP